MSRPPPLRRSRRLSPPSLVDDAMREIFLRLPPDDLASLVRAAAVCKSWRLTLSDAAFARLYRAFHGAPPVLGSLHNSCYGTHCVSRFVPAAGSNSSSFRPPGFPDRRDWFVLDSRHGRILFWTTGEAEEFVVCDPMTDARWEFSPSSTHSDILFVFDAEIDQNLGLTWNTAVLCSNDRCDHLDCRGGPFRVVLVCSDEAEGITFATAYSSEAGEWSQTITLHQSNAISDVGHLVLLEDKMYFPCETAGRIVEYNMCGSELSAIDTPSQGQEHLALMAADDGMLLFVGMLESKLHLCSLEAGAVAWARSRVIELKPLLPTRTLTNVSVVGVVEGASVIFLSTKTGLFMIDLDSGRREKVYSLSQSEGKSEAFIKKIIPYTSFYPVVRRRLPGH